MADEAYPSLNSEDEQTNSMGYLLPLVGCCTMEGSFVSRPPL